MNKTDAKSSGSHINEYNHRQRSATKRCKKETKWLQSAATGPQRDAISNSFVMLSVLRMTLINPLINDQLLVNDDQKPDKHLCPVRLCVSVGSFAANLLCRADNVTMDICSSAQHLTNVLTANM